MGNSKSKNKKPAALVAQQRRQIPTQRASQLDTTRVLEAQQQIEHLCKKNPGIAQYQDIFDQLFSTIKPSVYKSLVTTSQGGRFNLLHPILRYASRLDNTSGPGGLSEDDLYELMEANPFLVPSCAQPGQILTQTLSIYLRCASIRQSKLKGIQLLLSRIENITLDVVYSVYMTFEEYIQTSSISTQAVYDICMTMLNFVATNAPNIKLDKGDYTPLPTPDYKLGIHAIILMGARIHHRVQVAPLFWLVRSNADSPISRRGLRDVLDIYGYDFYHPLHAFPNGFPQALQMSQSLPYPFHCIFQAPIVGGIIGMDNSKPTIGRIIDLDGGLITTTLPVSRCGSTFSFLSQQKIFSLDLVIYLLHLAASDQVRVIKKYLNGGYPPGITNDDELYSAIAEATKEWMHQLSSSSGIPALAIYLGQMLSLGEKVLSAADPTAGLKIVCSFQPLCASALKFVVSMCNTYKERTLFFDGSITTTDSQGSADIGAEFNALSKDQQDVIHYSTITKVYQYNPFPLMFSLRLISWLSSFAPNHVDDDNFDYLQLFIGQLLPASFSCQSVPMNRKHQALGKKDGGIAPTKPQVASAAPTSALTSEVLNATVTTIEDKHKLSFAPYKHLWEDESAALKAYTHFDNSLPLYSDSTLKIQELWHLVQHYNYDDISSLQIAYQPFFQTLLFPHFALYNKKTYILTTMLASLGMLANVYTRPNFITARHTGQIQSFQPAFTRDVNIKHPKLMMQTAAIGGTAVPKTTVFAYTLSPSPFLFNQVQTVSVESPTVGSFVPVGVYHNPMSLTVQFPAIFTASIPTSIPLPSTDSLAKLLSSGSSYNEASVLQQQLAFTRHILTAMTHNTANQNISLHLFVLHILQSLFVQAHSAIPSTLTTAASITPACVIRTHIGAAFHQLKTYMQQTGSLFLQLSAEDKPRQQIYSSLNTNRSITSPQEPVKERFIPPLQNIDFHSSPARRQYYLAEQLPILQQTINLLCSTGLIWTLLLPNVSEIFNVTKIDNSQQYSSPVLSGTGYAALGNIYSMIMLTLIQIWSLQAYIVEQQEGIISPLKPEYCVTTRENIQSTPSLPFKLGHIDQEQVTIRDNFTQGQMVNFTLMTYLCYLPPMAPNTFAATPVGAFFRIADVLIEKLQHIVSTANLYPNVVATAQITPLEYFCAILCYQAFVYEPSELATFINASGITDINRVTSETSDVGGGNVVGGDKKPKPVEGSMDKDTKKVRYANVPFGNKILLSFDLSAYDTTTLPELPEISHAFLWLLYSSKIVERFKFKRSCLASNLETFIQDHYQVALANQSLLTQYEQAGDLPALPLTPQLMYYIDCTITTYTHFYQWNNHYTGLKQMYTAGVQPLIDQGRSPPLDHEPPQPKKDDTDSTLASKVTQCVTNVPTTSLSIELPTKHCTVITPPSTGPQVLPYQSLGLLAFILDCVYQPSIDDVMALLQGISPTERSLNLLRGEADANKATVTAPSTESRIDSVQLTATYENTEAALADFRIVPSYIDNLARTVVNPIRPYTYTKFTPTAQIYTQSYLFSTIRTDFVTDAMDYFVAELVPTNRDECDAIDNVEATNGYEYVTTLGVEIFTNAILRRLPQSIISALLNVIGIDTILQASRPMYMIDPVTHESQYFNIFDFILAADGYSLAPDVLKTLYDASVSM